MKIRVYGNAAIATYRTTDKLIVDGQTLNLRVRWTDTAIKVKGKWLFAAASGVPEPAQ